MHSQLLKFVKNYTAVELATPTQQPLTSPTPSAPPSPPAYAAESAHPVQQMRIEEVRSVLRGFIENDISDTIAIAGNENRTLVTPSDVIEALKIQGRPKN